MKKPHLDKKVVLFIPNTKWKNEDTFLSIPHSIAILASILKTEFDVEVLDSTGGDLSVEETRQRLIARKPDAVLMNGQATFHHPKSIHFSMDMVKSVCPDTITVLGGVYPTIQPRVALEDSNIDYVFVGHAEERVTEFLNAIFDGNFGEVQNAPGIGYRNDADGEIVITPLSAVIADVERQVQPDYTLFDVAPYLRQEIRLGTATTSSKKVAPILTSYGCPYRCTFCATRTISGRRVAYRPIEDVFAEIDDLVDNHGADEILFYDDNLLLKRERIEAICQAFIDKRWGDVKWKTGGLMVFLLDDELLELMGKAGCSEIAISVESGSERVSKELVKKPINLEDVPGVVKKCHEMGILIKGQFVIGFPGETWEEIRETFAFAERCDFDLSHFLIATPLPNTELYDMAVGTGSLLESFELVDPEFNGWNTGFIETDEFRPYELAVLRTYEWDRINFKTPEKRQKAATLYRMSLDQLEEHRRKTRAALGALSVIGAQETQKPGLPNVSAYGTN